MGRPTKPAPDCNCCVELPPVNNCPIYPIWTNNGLELIYPQQSAELHFKHQDEDPSVFFATELFGPGASLNNATIDHPRTRAFDLDRAIRVELSATASGDFTSGVIFWKPAAVTFNPATRFTGHQFGLTTAAAGLRNAIRDGEQYYENRTGTPGLIQPATDRPLICFGLVVEQSGTRYYSAPAIPSRWDDCWNGLGATWGAMPTYRLPVVNNAWTLDGAGKPTPSQVENWSFPNGPLDDVDNVGIYVALTTWEPVGENWISRAIGSGSWTETLLLHKPQAASCWKERCFAYYHTRTSLTWEFLTTSPDALEPTHAELQGISFPLTRSYGDDTFTGSSSVTVPARDHVGTVHPYRTAVPDYPPQFEERVRFGKTPSPIGAADPDWTNWIPTDGITNGDIQAAWTALHGSGTVAGNWPGPLTWTQPGETFKHCLYAHTGAFSGETWQNLMGATWLSLWELIAVGTDAHTWPITVTMQFAPDQFTPQESAPFARINHNCAQLTLTIGPLVIEFPWPTIQGPVSGQPAYPGFPNFIRHDTPLIPYNLPTYFSTRCDFSEERYSNEWIYNLGFTPAAIYQPFPHLPLTKYIRTGSLCCEVTL